MNGLSGAAAALSLTRAVRPTFAAEQIAAPPKGSSVHFALTATDGAAVTEQNYRDKWLAVYFGYTFCPDICPTTMMELADTVKSLASRADAVQVVFITVDPRRDKPDVLAEYLKNFDPRFVGLTGSPAQFPRPQKASMSSMSAMMPMTATTPMITVPTFI